jgi:NADPH-dependent 2,4-dienoyl-CoA reductase/sulfur reductase-like enzyme/nitrite reductase/ring-hydroxylating ferredoxin subunit
MSETDGDALAGPDLRVEGVALADIPDPGMLIGHVDETNVVLVRKGDTVHGIGATCTHYGGPLAEGLFDGEFVRCPWHHACFRPDTGEAVHAPAIDPVASFAVERRGDRVFVTGSREVSAQRAPISEPPSSVVIVGGGAAGLAAAEMLRREGYAGPVTLISADADAPYDRPNCSKDYLAGTAQAEWMPLRPAEWYETERIELILGHRVTDLMPAERQIRLDDGRTMDYGALLLATGATPVQLDTPGSERPHVHYLRSLRDSDAIIASAEQAQHAVVVGASFIGLEVAASLTTRNLQVHVVAPEATPMELVLGAELGGFVRSLHEEHGVHFHMGRTVSQIGERSVTLDDGSQLQAELVVFGVGVRPNVQLAERAGLAVDQGVLVDEYLRTSAEGIWAAGDIARWPDAYSGERIRVEHWVVAERQGQTAARNILGRGERFSAAPFFWSQHYDVPINVVGSARRWDDAVVAGSIAERDCLVGYRRAGKTLAVASIYRDQQSLEAEVAMERGDSASVERLLSQ